MVSPKKTVEGAVGGVLGTMVFGVLITVIYSIAADRMEEFTRSNIGVSMYVIIALLACVAAVLGIYGDLFAAWSSASAASRTTAPSSRATAASLTASTA